MKIKAVLFDLDGTLLPQDQDVFVETYFRALSRRFADRYAPDALIAAVWHGTEAMMANDGSRTNEQAFWKAFAERLGEVAQADKAEFDRFYREEFNTVQAVCGFNPLVPATIARLHEQGFRLILATNPIFPYEAAVSRAAWAGIELSDFEWITTYENSRYSKPNPLYYQDIADQAGLPPEACLMVGNDVGDDMAAARIGMRVFLLTDCLINKTDESVDRYPHGGFAELCRYIDECNEP